MSDAVLTWSFWSTYFLSVSIFLSVNLSISLSCLSFLFFINFSLHSLLPSYFLLIPPFSFSQELLFLFFLKFLPSLSSQLLSSFSFMSFVSFLTCLAFPPWSWWRLMFAWRWSMMVMIAVFCLILVKLYSIFFIRISFFFDFYIIVRNLFLLCAFFLILLRLLSLSIV